MRKSVEISFGIALNLQIKLGRNYNNVSFLFRQGFCISYLLLITVYHKTKQLETRDIYNAYGSVIWKQLTGCFRLRMSHEAPVKLLATATAVSGWEDQHPTPLVWFLAEDVLSSFMGASLITQWVKNLPAMQETQKTRV